MKIATLSGSLRPASASTAILHAFADVCAADDAVTLFDGLDRMPHFSPERDIDPAPPAVQALRALLSASDAVVICTPEYAHGMPGVLKNALDWLVGSGELIGKPVAALSASPSADGGAHARAWLVQTLTVMSANVVPEASFAIGLVRAKLGPDNRIADPATVENLRGISAAMRAAAESPL